MNLANFIKKRLKAKRCCLRENVYEESAKNSKPTLTNHK